MTKLRFQGIKNNGNEISEHLKKKRMTKTFPVCHSAISKNKKCDGKMCPLGITWNSFKKNA